ncbi:MAG TPA: S8 family serine peptidase, partial [Terriglobia bacterium]|nr:S8 family serine peptidase [Terriglobia bacterium]
MLLAFRNGIQQSRQDAVLANVGASEIKRIGVNVRVVAVKSGHVPEIVQLLRARSEVRFAEPDYLQTLSAGSPPNDTSFGIQWAHQNTGQMVSGVTGTPGADQRTLAAWGITTGTNSVVIAELDTGVQYSHPDLFTNMWNNPGGIGGCAAGTHGYNVLALNCDPMDDEIGYGGHGTHVAGIMGAVGNNASGVAGVNWTTSIMAVKWVNSIGVGATSDLITAMDWVVKAKQAGVNVRVVNDSQTYTGTAFSQALSDEIDLLGTNGILFVTASGNTAQNNDVVPRYPCSYNRAANMICVAASDQNDNLWSSANFGSNTVKLAAPGVNIYSTLRNSNFGYISGGSMAAPQVSATAALILSLGSMDVTSLKWMILLHTDGLPSLSGLVTTGGRLNVCKAVPGCSTAVPGILTNKAVPVVTSIPQQGGLLGASTGLWQGVPSAYTYQWNRCDQNGLNCSPIAGATGQNYAMLAPADALATLSVTVTASNSFGSASATSAPSSAVAVATSASPIASSITAGTNISGSVNWTVTPARSEQFVQFYVDGALKQTDSTSPYVFNGSTTSLLDSTALPNGPHVLGVRALFTDNRVYDFFGETVTVANTPQNTALPTISGTLMPGQTISTSTGTWGANAPPTSFTFQWEHCDSSGFNCSIISGATSSNYTLTGADSNFSIRSLVTGSNSGGSATAVSAQTAIVPVSPLGIATTSLPGGTQNVSYSTALAANGGIPPYSWSIASGTLPSGLSLASSTGVISGTPTGSGTSSFTVRVSDSRSVTATQALSLTVTARSSPNITTTSLPAGTQNAAYSATLAATGGTPPYSWSIASGTLPSGLSLASSTGVISGTSTLASTSNFTVQVSDANSLTNTKALSITINSNSIAGGGIGLVQANAAQGVGVGSVSVAFPASNTAGNLIIAFVRMATASQTVTVTDSAGNSYVDAVAHTQSIDSSQVHLFYARNISGAASNTVTATFSASNSQPWLAIYEYKGLSSSNPLDQTAQGEGSSSTPSTGATAMTTSPNELVFAGFEFSSSYWEAP